MSECLSMLGQKGPRQIRVSDMHADRTLHPLKVPRREMEGKKDERDPLNAAVDGKQFVRRK